MHRRRLIIGSALLLGGILVVALLVREPRFRGKPKSEWIAGIVATESDYEVLQWREFGRDGVLFLGRALDNTDTPMQRAHAWVYSKLPAALANLLPKPAEHGKERMKILGLLLRLGISAHPAEASIAGALKDPDSAVARVAIGCYGEGGLLLAMSEDQKAARLRDILPFLQQNDWRAVNSAALALTDYRQQTDLVVPELVKRLSKADAWTQTILWQTLAQLDREAALRAGAVRAAISMMQTSNPDFACRGASILGSLHAEPKLSIPALAKAAESGNIRVADVSMHAIARFTDEASIHAGIVPTVIRILRHPDSRSAHRGAAVLGALAAEPDLSVPALIAAAQGSDTLVAVSAMRALEGFTNETALILPVLTNALKSTHGAVRRQAGETLRRLSPSAPVTTEAKR